MIKYRTESFSGSGVRELKEVLKYEIFELYNIDILDTLLDNKLLIPEDSPIRDDIEKMIEVVSESSDDINEENQDSFINAVYCQINQSLWNHCKKELHYGLWLADYDEVKNNYHGDDYDIDAYETSEFILSDLQSEGCLYAYEKKPRPILRED